jgi:hypothetical protein
VRDRGSGWSALQRLGHVAELLHATPGRLDGLRRNAELLADEVVIDTPRAGDDDRDPSGVLSVLATDADRVAAVAASMTGDDWRHTLRRNGVDVTARDVLQEVVHDGVHHLREAACHLGLLAATPPPPHADADAWGVRGRTRTHAQQERRRHPRVALVVDAGVKLGGDGPGVRCETSDVSESGVRLRTAGAPVVPGPAFLVLVPSQGQPIASLVELLESRWVGRAPATEIHARFLRMPPESRVRLERLIAAAGHPSTTHAERRWSRLPESADGVGTGEAARLLHMAPGRSTDGRTRVDSRSPADEDATTASHEPPSR